MLKAIIALILAAFVLAGCGTTRQIVLDVPIKDVAISDELRDCDASKPTKPARRGDGSYSDKASGVFLVKTDDWARHCSGDNAALIAIIDAFNAGQAELRARVAKAKDEID